MDLEDKRNSASHAQTKSRVPYNIINPIPTIFTIQLIIIILLLIYIEKAYYTA